MLSAAIVLVAASTTTRAQFPGATNPWQQGRPGLPPVNGGFNPFGQNRPGLPGVPHSGWPPGRVGGFDRFGQGPGIPGLPGASLPGMHGGRDPFAIPGVPPSTWPPGRVGGFDRFGQGPGIPSVEGPVNDLQKRPPVTPQPWDPVNVQHLPPEELARLLPTRVPTLEAPKLELPKSDLPSSDKVFPWLLPILLGIGYMFSELFKEQKE
jgi:hypothetical protein